MEPPTSICFGEALIDHHAQGSVVAGAPLHVAARLASSGWNSLLLTRVASDAPGARIVETARRLGIDDRLIQTDPDLPSGSAVVRDGKDGADRFELAHPVAWDRIEVPDQLPAHDVLYFGSLVGRDEPSRRALFATGEMSTAPIKVCDVNLRAPWVDHSTIDWALAHANVVKCSTEELAMLSPKGVAGLFDAHDQLELVAVTAGSDGAALHRRDVVYQQSAPSVDVVDTVGAGDAFTAALIEGLRSGMDDPGVLRHAIEFAGRAAGTRGGLPAPG
ncbi:MAG: PfkB family carbohydrate kinase [Acidimicrobiia bacterium]|nr:PfkB family carbohydrate kinase [Acidimicrobiia bacterium]